MTTETPDPRLSDPNVHPAHPNADGTYTYKNAATGEIFIGPAPEPTPEQPPAPQPPPKK